MRVREWPCDAIWVSRVYDARWGCEKRGAANRIRAGSGIRVGQRTASLVRRVSRPAGSRCRPSLVVSSPMSVPHFAFSVPNFAYSVPHFAYESQQHRRCLYRTVLEMCRKIGHFSPEEDLRSVLDIEEADVISVPGHHVGWCGVSTRRRIGGYGAVVPDPLASWPRGLKDLILIPPLVLDQNLPPRPPPFLELPALTQSPTLLSLSLSCSFLLAPPSPSPLLSRSLSHRPAHPRPLHCTHTHTHTHTPHHFPPGVYHARATPGQVWACTPSPRRRRCAGPSRSTAAAPARSGASCLVESAPPNSFDAPTPRT
eukprot:1265728-Rhodomonas_salina.3